MKKIILCIILAVVFAACATRQQTPPADIRGKPEEEKPAAPGMEEPESRKSVNLLAGTWNFENPGYEGTIIAFDPNGNVSMILDENNQVTGTYQVDYNAEPVALDIYWDGMEENAVFRTIVRFLDENKMQMENNEIELDRPVVFSDNSLIMVRQQ